MAKGTDFQLVKAPDGFYFAKSLRLLTHIFENPELLDKPLGEPSGFDYEK